MVGASWSSCSDQGVLSHSLAWRWRAINYYRQSFFRERQDPALAECQRTVGAHPVFMPGLYIHGQDDGCIGWQIASTSSADFCAGFQQISIAGAGHIVQLEQPVETSPAVLRLLRPWPESRSMAATQAVWNRRSATSSGSFAPNTGRSTAVDRQGSTNGGSRLPRWSQIDPLPSLHPPVRMPRNRRSDCSPQQRIRRSSSDQAAPAEACLHRAAQPVDWPNTTPHSQRSD